MRIPSGSAPRPRRRGGATAAEFAICLPVLVLLVLGCLDFGRFAYNYIGVTNAARAGAAYGIMNPYTSGTLTTWQAAVAQHARAEMTGQTDFNPATLTVTSSSTVDSTNGIRRVRVECSCPFQTIVPWPGLPTNVTLRRVIEMPSIR